ncbi:MAG: TolA energization system membrane component TolR [Saliniramus fredricksonii]|uniref:Cell division and transport-associated protein TolR n=1 Tax=Saliniramus fredricksonii TaxID=1653334 RepID=A0A0P8A4M2_9HYPH|nr:biopolymer transporter ExbD [Saliniramus fredricksonii]KPQ12575.1 MAG: TolA energization system membrane component TolR [Saliniramus fredricksonii]SCC82750.1 Cell division and transport-associated protein TolR [Saliniramus fredricksonii]
MVMSHGGPGNVGGGARRRRRGRKRAINEINMTPFIDVMLVLLIVFMVSAPLLSAGVPLDLPESRAGALNVESRPITLSIDAQGRVFLDDDEIPDADIVSAIGERVSAGAQDRVYVRGDRRVDYGRVAEVMSIVTDGGYRRVALVTLPQSQQ